MAPRRSARILAANQASPAAPPLTRRAAFLRAVEAISVHGRRRTTTTASRRRRTTTAASRRRAIQIAPNQPPAEDPPVVNRRETNRARVNGYLDGGWHLITRENFELRADLEMPHAMTAGRGAAAPENVMGTELGVRRLHREMAKMTSDPTDGCTVELVDDCIYVWKAVILGPLGTPYEGGHFELRLHFPQTYPARPPAILFRTRVYHCNIYRQDICVDILHSAWSPALTVEKILLSIRSLLSDPNPESPLNGAAAQLYKTNREQHDRRAQEWTARYAQPVDSTSE
ncbi:GL22790 [Drosophila persimilis]|uniref:E2 ubiquitin-conjugating enzyme n=1 Tax=Drosophila persimilis TaxID=7234 RepID=B4GZJ4_DROPE|nr:ubiquitin-conjugating enzyme E2 D2 [Drosophila persimilis]XP_002024026.1 ubiquitin-conjugating enzyme E2 D2 [Drosophila persimilis]EDW29421.1 GL22792 [Drosophila persimilis]EDW29424.1 GL22790 [Drosophila persimilis]